MGKKRYMFVTYTVTISIGDWIIDSKTNPPTQICKKKVHFCVESLGHFFNVKKGGERPRYYGNCSNRRSSNHQ